MLGTPLITLRESLGTFLGNHVSRSSGAQPERCTPLSGCVRASYKCYCERHVKSLSLSLSLSGAVVCNICTSLSASLVQGAEPCFLGSFVIVILCARLACPFANCRMHLLNAGKLSTNASVCVKEFDCVRI